MNKMSIYEALGVALSILLIAFGNEAYAIWFALMLLYLKD